MGAHDIVIGDLRGLAARLDACGQEVTARDPAAPPRASDVGWQGHGSDCFAGAMDRRAAHAETVARELARAHAALRDAAVAVARLDGTEEHERDPVGSGRP